MIHLETNKAYYYHHHFIKHLRSENTGQMLKNVIKKAINAIYRYPQNEGARIS